MAVTTEEKVTVKLPTLKDQHSYECWKWQLDGEVERLELTAHIAAVLALTSGAAEPTLADAEKKRYAMLGSRLRSCLEGDALQLVGGQRVTTAGAIIAVLERSWGVRGTIDCMSILQKFTSEKWEPRKEDLAMFIARKYSSALKIPQLIPDAALNLQMSTVLTTCLPAHFNTICNEIRSNPPADWRAVEKRLLDADKVFAEKKEVQGTALFAGGDSSSELKQFKEEMMKEVKAFFAKTAKGGGKGGKVRKNDMKCFHCNKLGHKKQDCFSFKRKQKEEAEKKKKSV